eukprot:14181-Heterococcus_DN1.PRE.2
MEKFIPSLNEGDLITSRQLALDYIGKRGCPPQTKRQERMLFAKDHIRLQVHTHSYFSVQLDQDDRDHYGKKRLDLAGPLVAGLLRTLFRALTRGCAVACCSAPNADSRFQLHVSANVRKHLQKCVDEGRATIVLGVAIKSNVITNGLKYSIATGNWGERKSAVKTGVSQWTAVSVPQLLSVHCAYTVLCVHAAVTAAGAQPFDIFISTVTLTKAQHTPWPRRQTVTACNRMCAASASERTSSTAKPRQLHNTHWGMICPAETPEGQPQHFPQHSDQLEHGLVPESSHLPLLLNLLLSLLVQAVGLVKNLALMAYITVDCPASPILEFLEEWSVENITEIDATTVAEKSCTKVFVNGKPAVPLADDLLQCLRTMCYYNNTCDTTGNAYIELFTA